MGDGREQGRRGEREIRNTKYEVRSAKCEIQNGSLVRKDGDGSGRAKVGHFGGDVFADFETGCGGGRRGVAHVEGVLSGGDVKIVNELSVFTESLGANAGGTG